MRKGIAILLIVAASLVLLGVLVFTVGIVAMDDPNVSPLFEGKYQSKTYEGEDKITSIIINTDTTDILFRPYSKDGYKVECFEEINLSHTVTVKNGVLSINLNDNREWYDHISIFSRDTQITVYLPAGEYASLSVKTDTADTTVPKNFTFDTAAITCTTGDVEFCASTKTSLNIKASTGDIDVEDSGHGDFNLTVSTGEIEIGNVNCNNATIRVSTGKTEIDGMACTSFTSTGNTGDLFMTNLISAGSVKITRSTGDVIFNRCDASELEINTDTGDVMGTLLSAKIFVHRTSTGDVKLPETTTGGKCKITTNTGDIKISIAQ